MEIFISNELRKKVEEWRNNNYECNYPAISEILEFSFIESKMGQTQRYLRKAQFESLEIYWYLRLVEGTPHIFDLYKRFFQGESLLNSLNIHLSEDDWRNIALSGKGLDSIFERIKVKNALVFAPGKTILGALKEISDIPYEKILPSRFYKQFISSVKITYTQDKQKDIPVIRSSSFNIIVTNTEKIRIQKPTGKTIQSNLLNYKEMEKYEKNQEIVNLRLQIIASLPNLAIFSDEAHHTYGQSLDSELKKVRKTVNYLAEHTNVVVVVNTTGTPYYKKQMLHDVVYWYGLSQGINDGILKEVKDSIFAYDLKTEDFVTTVLGDFFKDYKDVTVLGGMKSKIAIYFPQTDDVKQIRPLIEQRLLELGLDPSVVLEVNNTSGEDVKDLFNNRVNDVHNPFRVYLLVNMGTEGWNCPSLFATALARKLKSSNNFVLQSATRCLRQVPNNIKKARIYLSNENVNVLDSQLKETYGETLQILNMTKQEFRKAKLVLRKTEIPPIFIKRKMLRVIVDENRSFNIHISKPMLDKKVAKKTTYDVQDYAGKKKVLQASKMEEIILSEDFIDSFEVATELSALYRMEPFTMHELLKTHYPDGEVPSTHIDALRKQIEKQIQNYKIIEEEVEVALALVKIDGFDKEKINGKTIFTTEIIYHKDKEDLLVKYGDFKERNEKDFGFHYSPYNMDSHPEKDFFEQLLHSLNENPDDIEDIYFIGGIIDKNKTDFLFDYLDKNGKYRSYTPDFLIKKKNGKILIVEIKAERFREELKEMAMKELECLNPDKFKYEILLTSKGSDIGYENIQKVKEWMYEGNA
ncbi:MAG: DEAD/DEAH box helicase family protein [Candidatus Aenigmarchaeota archaeon]|nr:DEAD/DEAH box helicase family protein [Candidatus Aenigmarchaeota archaeon]